ncbi:protein kinase [[Kitasatospora] papulosa]|uniref:serine/threonine-protein kinase n=1 Tax=Streptomyces TaxID=1883 RepID=UPI0022564BF8|nr:MULTISPECIES: serine/threonine-protein kinase [Streptomyces]MCX4417868.1 protein kinase [[Kitasatospora] papulosa]MCY1649367.1 serine/threonine-protein kinase [Streptomyces sp. SL203]MCY1677079.1 serine/threonine-protein kinase [Streptomyces sp. SL294]
MWDLREGDPTRIGSFRLVARLGSGGMGTVYLAAQEGREGYVAVKTIRNEFVLEEGFQRRFTREATAASSVRSPYTVRVVGFDTQAREPWLATEYVEGLSLRDHVQRHGPLELDAAVDLALGLSFGLASIHKAGLVHRDLKPGNVLLTNDGPKIIDFGLAYATDFSHATQTGAVLGTPGYFSPEQVQGRQVSAASDIFALGAVLTYASSGDHAFRGVTPLTAQYHVVHEEPFLSNVSEELRDLIAACMHKDPRERPLLSDVLAHLTSLRSYGHKQTAMTFRRSPLADPSGIGAADDPATVVPALTRRNRLRQRAAFAVTGVVLFAAGVAASVWLLPGHTRPDPRAVATPTAPAPSAPTSSTSPPDQEPTMTPAVEDPVSEPDRRSEALLSSLEYNPMTEKCAMDGDMGVGVDTAAQDFGFSVKPLTYRNGYIAQAVVNVNVPSRAAGDQERPVVHVKLPKGEDIPLTVPEGKSTWSFRWPDILQTAPRTEMQSPYEQMKPIELMGPYTIAIFHYSIVACGGFLGDPHGAASSP